MQYHQIIEAINTLAGVVAANTPLGSKGEETIEQANAKIRELIVLIKLK